MGSFDKIGRAVQDLRRVPLARERGAVSNAKGPLDEMNKFEIGSIVLGTIRKEKGATLEQIRTALGQRDIFLSKPTIKRIIEGEPTIYAERTRFGKTYADVFVINDEA